jgi:thioredoxin 1
MPALTHVSSDDFETTVLGAKVPVLVEFGAPWCAPCKMLEPVLAELAQTYLGKVLIVSVDVDASPDLAMAHGVMGVPTLILFRDGQEQARRTGFIPKGRLIRKFFKDIQPQS